MNAKYSLVAKPENDQCGRQNKSVPSTGGDQRELKTTGSFRGRAFWAVWVILLTSPRHVWLETREFYISVKQIFSHLLALKTFQTQEGVTLSEEELPSRCCTRVICFTCTAQRSVDTEVWTSRLVLVPFCWCGGASCRSSSIFALTDEILSQWNYLPGTRV